MEDSLIVMYRVDPQDQIIYANDDWDAFALLNDMPQLKRQLILGQSLWRFISDQDSEQLYRDLMHRVRSGRPAVFRYHCDGAAMERILEMHVQLVGQGVVQFTSSTQALNPRDPIPLLDPARPRSAQGVRMCGWCQRVQIGQVWIDMSMATAKIPAAKDLSLPALIHTTCPNCYRRMQEVVASTRGVHGN